MHGAARCGLQCGGLVPQPVMVLVAAIVIAAFLAFFKFLLNSTWTTQGAIICAVLLGLWLIFTIVKKGPKVWIGPVPVLGIFFALIMTGPLVEDIIVKALTGDPIPAILLSSYLGLGALIYIGYGYRNSRLGKGLRQIDDDDGPDAGPGPLQAELHGLGDPKS